MDGASGTVNVKRWLPSGAALDVQPSLRHHQLACTDVAMRKLASPPPPPPPSPSPPSLLLVLVLLVLLLLRSSMANWLRTKPGTTAVPWKVAAPPESAKRSTAVSVPRPGQ